MHKLLLQTISNLLIKNLLNQNLTWDASMFCDRWNMKGDGEGMLWEHRRPFSESLSPGKEETRCATPVVGKASGFTDKCPEWNNKGAPSLRNCWLCALEKSKLWKWPEPRDDELRDGSIIGRRPYLISHICFSEESVSTQRSSCGVVNTFLSLVVPCVPSLFSLLFTFKVNVCSVLEQLASFCRSASESLPELLSSVGKSVLNVFVAQQ